MNLILELIGTLLALAFLYIYRNNGKDKPRVEDSKEDLRPELRIYCERIHGVHYAWLKESKEFIGQSESPKELATMLLTRYPTKKYNVIIEEKVVV